MFHSSIQLLWVIQASPLRSAFLLYFGTAHLFTFLSRLLFNKVMRSTLLHSFWTIKLIIHVLWLSNLEINSKIPFLAFS